MTIVKTNSLDFDAQALREKILDLAMRGKLVPQDPNDESASVLLEKIKAEKAELIKEKKIKKTKPLPPITDDEKPFDIPDSWEWVRLGDVGNWAAGATPSRKHPEYYGGNIPWLKTGDLNDDVVEDTTEKITKLGVENSSVKINKPGNVLIAMYGATIGKLGIVGNKELVTNQACCGCTPFNGVYNWYLFYYLFASRKRLIDLGSGGAQPNISKQKIENFSFPLPPLSEQSRIAAKIAQLFALLRKVESSTQQYAKLQTLLKSKVLDLAMRGKLVKQDPNDEPASVLLEKIKTEKAELVKEKKIKKSKPLPPITDEEKPFDIPDSWEWVRLGDVIKPEVHKKPTKNFTYIDIASVDNKKNQIANPNKIDIAKDKIASRARQELDSNDILFSVVRPYLKNIALVPDNDEYKVGSTGFYVLKPFKLISRKYIFYLVLSGYVISKMTQKMKGDNSPSIRKGDLQGLIIPLPPLSEQSRIAAKIAQLFALLRKVETSTQQYAKLQTLLKSKVLDLAMRGKLVKQDPNDEPASELLKKIKAEKAELVKEKKIKKSKPLPEITYDEKPFDLPDSWEWVRLGEVGSVKNGKTPKKEDINSQGPYPYFKVKDMNNNRLYMNKVESYVDEKYKNQLLPKNTIIFPKNGGAVLTAKKRILIQASLVDLNTGGLVPNSNINCKYLFYLFKSLNIKDYVKGSAVPTINSKKLKETVVPLPPLSEQSRIAAKIAQIFALLRKGAGLGNAWEVGQAGSK